MATIELSEDARNLESGIQLLPLLSVALVGAPQANTRESEFDILLLLAEWTLFTMKEQAIPRNKTWISKIMPEYRFPLKGNCKKET